MTIGLLRVECIIEVTEMYIWNNANNPKMWRFFEALYLVAARSFVRRSPWVDRGAVRWILDGHLRNVNRGRVLHTEDALLRLYGARDSNMFLKEGVTWGMCVILKGTKIKIISYGQLTVAELCKL